MAKTNSKQNHRRKSWTFSLKASEAREVFLTGDFNNWHPEKHPMREVEHGTWGTLQEIVDEFESLLNQEADE